MDNGTQSHFDLVIQVPESLAFDGRVRSEINMVQVSYSLGLRSKTPDSQPGTQVFSKYTMARRKQFEAK
jgi:hypothetical protein